MRTSKSTTTRDLISELPDPILHHILSFLDMKYVMRTSFLSRRWRYLWTSLPFLDFNDYFYDLCRMTVESDINDENPSYKNDFTDFVDRVLFLRNQNSIIQKFRLCCQDFQFKMLGRIYTWIRVLVRSNVQVLDLQVLSTYETLEFIHCLFTCKTLTTLKLNMGDQSPEINLPTDSMVCLPSLKTLYLRFLSIERGVEYLISSCPVLETLTFSHCTNRGGNSQLSISVLQLKNLVIKSMYYECDEFPDYSCFKVFAPKLISFRCRDYLINDYSFVDRSLVNARIETNYQSGYYFLRDDYEYWEPKKQIYIQNVMKCLTGIYYVRHLTLSARLLEVVIEGHADLGSLPSFTFSNLRLLKLKTILAYHEICGMTYLLLKCPHLETLEIEPPSFKHVTEVEYNPGKEDKRWGTELAPECMMYNLKIIKIRGVFATMNLLEFLMFLLKNSIILEKMIVLISKQQPLNNDMELKQFREKLTTFPAASSRIEILFLSLKTLKLDFGPKNDRGFFKIVTDEEYDIKSSLTKLKTLHLRSIWFVGGICDSFISMCRNLETLVISNCSLDIDSELNISHYQLKHLVLEKLKECSVMVLAPRLMSFRCRDYPINDYSFESTYSLVEADIDTDYYLTDSELGKISHGWNMNKCLRELHKVRSLTLSAWLLQLAFQNRDDWITLPINQFCNLRYLTLKTSLSISQIRATVYLLEKCPQLETLVLKITEVNIKSGQEKEIWEANLAPKCMMYQLKFVEIWGVQTTANGLEFLKFLLKNATILEKLVAYIPQEQPNNAGKLRRFSEMLRSFGGASSSVRISFL